MTVNNYNISDIGVFNSGTYSAFVTQILSQRSITRKHLTSSEFYVWLVAFNYLEEKRLTELRLSISEEITSSTIF